MVMVHKLMKNLLPSNLSKLGGVDWEFEGQTGTLLGNLSPTGRCWCTGWDKKPTTIRRKKKNQPLFGAFGAGSLQYKPWIIYSLFLLGAWA